MTVNCIFYENCQRTFDIPEKLYTHLYSYHGSSNVIMYTVKQHFKINENIAELEKPDYHAMFKTLPIVKQTIVRILKSMLEGNQ